MPEPTPPAAAPFLAAAVQMRSTSDAEANWRQARELIERAAGHGARFVATPENTNYLGPHAEKVRRAEPLDGPTVGRFAELAARLGVHLLLGSFNERAGESERAGRCFNTSVLFGPDGGVLATYRKIHLFDVAVPGGVTFRESETVVPGEAPVTVGTPSAAWASRSAMTCASASSTAASPPMAPRSSPSPPPSRWPPARTTGSRCCAPARSRRSAG
jgi:predicted amidohydrolase